MAGILNNVSVTIESLTDKDDAGEGFDKVLSVTFKKYIAYGTKTVSLITDSLSGTVTAAVENIRETDNKEVSATYTVKSGDTLIAICKNQLGTPTNGQRLRSLTALKTQIRYMRGKC